MYLKFLIIQKTKAIFSWLRLHIIVEPFAGFFLNLAYLSKQSKWISEHRDLPYNDFFSGDRSRDKRLGLYQFLNTAFIKNNPINYLEFGVANGGSFYWWLDHHKNADSKFYGFDNIRKVFYYQAAAESPLSREVYFTSQDEKKKGKISTKLGTNDVDFSSNFNYYINRFSSSKTPTLISLHDNKGTQIRVLQDNTVLSNTVKALALPQKEFFQFEVKILGLDLQHKFYTLMRDRST